MMSIDTPERLEPESLDIAGDRIAKLREDFPEVFRDGKVDFETLKRALGEWVEPENERFGLQWPGKAAAFQAVQTPSVGTLLPDPDNSVEWDSTQNLIIEGDNLEVLKILQKSYYGKVKMIYIDPPYNTGNDFIYPDNFREGMQSYLEFTGQVNSEGKKLTTNTESAGRYHSNWLNMMYPRLYLARNLLRDDGVIFVSIDDHEVANLRALMNEVFGEDSFAGIVLWKKKTNGNNIGDIPPVHDYLVCFAKSLETQPIHGLPLSNEYIASTYSNPDNDPKGPWTITDLSANHVGPWFGITNPATREIFEPPAGRYWVFNEAEVLKRIADGRIIFGRTGASRPVQKKYLSERTNMRRVVDSWWDGVALNADGMKSLQDLLGAPKILDHPKPEALIQQVTAISTATDEQDLVIDFFAGSGTTGQAVMQQNAEDGGNRRYILVQLPEPIDPPKTLDDGTILSTIADITRERVRRAGQKIAAETGSVGVDSMSTRGGGSRVDTGSTPTEVNALDTGFRSYRLATSNFKPWDGTPPGAKQASMDLGVSAPDPAKQIAMQLEAFTDNVLPGRTQDDILAEIILRLGYELTVPVEQLTLAGQTVFSVDDGAVLACLDSRLSLALFEAMVALDPGQIVCLDSAFGEDDELKVNATQIMKARSRSDENSMKFWVV